MGVPERITRRFTSREFNAWNVSDSRYVEALGKQGVKGCGFIYRNFSSDVPRRKGEGQSCNSPNVLSGFSMSRTRRSLLRRRSSVCDPRWRTANSPGWVTFLPLAATQRATLSSSSAFPPFPSIARGDTVSLPSHFARGQSGNHFTWIQ
jgi:hypothetical protein